jgi:HAE1 family hydrophobic/amphiphilic exporter-1
MPAPIRGVSLCVSDRRKNAPHIDQVLRELRPLLASVPGIRAFPQTVQTITFGGRMAKSQYQFTLQCPDTDTLYHYAPLLESRLSTVPGLLEVTSDLKMSNPQVTLDIDRDKASALGLTAEQIEMSLYSAYGSRQVSTINAPNNQYKVIVELDPKYQLDPSALALLYIRSDSGEQIPISTFAKLRTTVGPLTINHQGQLPSVTISFNMDPEIISLGEAVEACNTAAREVLPDTITTSFQGTAQAFSSSMKGLGILLVMGVLVIYIVLGILYESFIHPITILSSLPSAGVGALLALLMLRMELGLYAFVGIIMLVGIVKKNAIMMIDFALEAQRNENLSPSEAIYQGCLIRFRPIMMTTFAAIVGTLPIAIGVGSGAAVRRPLGWRLWGGSLFHNCSRSTSPRCSTSIWNPFEISSLVFSANAPRSLFPRSPRASEFAAGTFCSPLSGIFVGFCPTRKSANSYLSRAFDSPMKDLCWD